MRQYDTVIFDLDGTLLNTLDDLADGVNYALALNSLPCRTVAEVRRFVGDGVAMLIARAVPAGTAEDLEVKCRLDFQARYLDHMQDKTAPYPGVPELLDGLKSAGVKLAVASNKFEDAVKALCPVYFGDRFHVAVGASDRVAKKPAPDMVFGAMAALGADPGRTVYVGDSDVDVKTARDAGLPCISVTWGFRDRACLAERGASVFVDTAEELARLLLQDE